MKIETNTYKEKVAGCFVGKSVGGTLGMKYEGDLNYNNVEYYDPVPDTMIPNDDLDLQVVNVETILRTGLPVCRYNVSEIWKYHIVEGCPDEYGVSVSNHRNKVFSPLSGIYRNKFTEGLGGAIRSEVWACLAPANPSLAAKLAKEDACTDHSENGIYAEMFLAAFESLAFVECDIEKITEIALQQIPDGSKLKFALLDTIKWFKETSDVLTVRKKILEHYHSDNWTNVCINLPFMLLSIIASEGDFDKAICTAASLGYDGDCTTATVGAIMGLLRPDSISEKWTAPIGMDLVLSPNIINMHEVRTIDEFCEQIISIAYDVQEYYKTGIEFSEKLAKTEKTALPKPWTENFEEVFDWEIGEKASVIAIKPLMISLVYPEKISVFPEQENSFKLRLANITNTKMEGNVELRLLNGWKAEMPNARFCLAAGERIELPLSVFVPSPKRRTNLNILSMDITINDVTTTVEAGLPMTRNWLVENSETKEKYLEETSGIYFKVPAGKYTYKTMMEVPAERKARMSANGSGYFKAYLNCVNTHVNSGDYYMPAFHREGNWKEVELLHGFNEIMIEFENSKETEFFLGFSTIYSCGEWLDSVEFTTEGI